MKETIEIPDKTDFQNNMKRLRLEMSETQQSMSEKIGRSKSMYQKCELGLRMWSAEYVGALESAFEKPFKEIYPRVFAGMTVEGEE